MHDMNLILSEVAEVATKPLEQNERTPEAVKYGASKERTDKRDQLLQQMTDNINKSQHLRVEITKGLAQGADHKEILEKALLCISLMTGDEAFYNVNRGRL
jgi:hypothetical protein